MAPTSRRTFTNSNTSNTSNTSHAFNTPTLFNRSNASYTSDASWTSNVSNTTNPTYTYNTSNASNTSQTSNTSTLFNRSSLLDRRDGSNASNASNGSDTSIISYDYTEDGQQYIDQEKVVYRVRTPRSERNTNTNPWSRLPYSIGPDNEQNFVTRTKVYTMQRCAAPDWECRWREIKPDETVVQHMGCGAMIHDHCFWYYNQLRTGRPDWNQRCPGCGKPN